MHQYIDCLLYVRPLAIGAFCYLNALFFNKNYSCYIVFSFFLIFNYSLVVISIVFYLTFASKIKFLIALTKAPKNCSGCSLISLCKSSKETSLTSETSFGSGNILSLE